MGTIGQQRQQGRSLEANGITDLLASQKDNIAAALPTGLSSLLGGTGLLDALGGAARTATAAGSEPAQVANSAIRVVGDTGRRAAGMAASRNWLDWLIPIAAIAALLIYYLGRPAEQVVQRALQHYLGHKNIQHTVRYTELAPDRFKDFWRN